MRKARKSASHPIYIHKRLNEKDREIEKEARSTKLAYTIKKSQVYAQDSNQSYQALKSVQELDAYEPRKREDDHNPPTNTAKSNRPSGSNASENAPNVNLHLKRKNPQRSSRGFVGNNFQRPRFQPFYNNIHQPPFQGNRQPFNQKTSRLCK